MSVAPAVPRMGVANWGAPAAPQPPQPATAPPVPVEQTGEPARRKSDVGGMADETMAPVYCG